MSLLNPSQLQQPHLDAARLDAPATGSRLSLFGVPLDLVDPELLLSTFSDWLNSDRAHFVITANALFLLDAERSADLREVCRKASLIIPDSSGIAWAARRYAAATKRMAGIDVAYQLCGLAEIKDKPVYLLGGARGVASRAAHFLCKKLPYLNVAGMRDGYFKESDETRILNDIASSRAKVVLVAMGQPKQEFWIYRNMHRLPPAVYIGVGGALDVWAGDLKRAPHWMQRMGVEWAYRLAQEPWRATRMWRLPHFALKVMLGHATRP